MDITDTPLNEIKPYAGNPRKFDEQAIDAVSQSLEEFGWKQPIVVDQDGVIVVGHVRYAAAQRLGYETIPVLHANDLTPKQAQRYRLADNRVAEFSIWNMDELIKEMSDLGDPDLPGWTEQDMESLKLLEEMGEVTHDEPAVDYEPDEPEVPAVVETSPDIKPIESTPETAETAMDIETHGIAPQVEDDKFVTLSFKVPRDLALDIRAGCLAVIEDYTSNVND